MSGSASANNSRLNYFIAGLSANIIWGFFAIPLRLIAAWPADTILYFRIFFSFVFVWMFLVLFRYSDWKRDWEGMKRMNSKERKRIIFLLFLSSILIMGNWFTFIYAVNNVSIKSAAFAYLICPLITTLAGCLILKEKLSKIKWISLSMALVSVIMLAQTSLIEVFWAILIASFYAFYMIIQRVLRDIDKFNFLAVQLVICSLIVLPMSFMSDTPVPSSLLFWGMIALIAIVFTIIPLFLSMYALNGIASATMGILIYINPIISFAVAVFYFNEIISIGQFLAYLLLLSAIVLYNSAFIRQIFSKLAKREPI